MVPLHHLSTTTMVTATKVTTSATPRHDHDDDFVDDANNKTALKTVLTEQGRQLPVFHPLCHLCSMNQWM